MASQSVSLSIQVVDAGGGMKKAIVNTKELTKVIKECTAATSDFSSRWLNSAAINATISGISSSVKGLADIFDSLAGESSRFTTAMREANTMAEKDAEGFGVLRSQVSELAKGIPVARDALAGGLYQVISNGVPEDNWISFLEASAKSSVGGLADLGQTVTVTSTIIKNYGKQWDEAAAIQDKIQLTAKNGVTSFEQLAQALPRVTGNAATLDVSIEELLGSFATLTGVSGNTAEVSTQLAAIFTALVKPSSEAAQMASAMGVKFDAAAIKAAGGFQSFLQQLDGTIKSYAQSTGMLEQEIYGKLFGSAEALRALIPLNGELADKFAQNVSAMQDSAGTMGAAYEEIASTAESKAQLIENRWGTVSDFFATFIVPVQPFLEFGSTLMGIAANVLILVATIKSLGVATAVMQAVKSGFVIVRNAVVGLTLQLNIATASSVALRTALNSIGIGVIITAVGLLAGYLLDLAMGGDDAAESMEGLTDASSQLEEIQRSCQDAASEAAVALDNDIASLQNLTDGTEEAAAKVSELNDRYGDALGQYASVAEWYDTLVSKGKLYVRQIMLEAQARAIADRMASLSVDMAKERRNNSELAKAKGVTDAKHWVDVGRVKNQIMGETDNDVEAHKNWYKHNEDYRRYIDSNHSLNSMAADYALYQGELDKVLKQTSELKKELQATKVSAVKAMTPKNMNYNQLSAGLQQVEDAMKNLSPNAAASEWDALIKKHKELSDARDVLDKKWSRSKKSGGGSKNNNNNDTIVDDPKTIEEYNKNIDITIKQLGKLDDAKRAAAIDKINLWRQSKNALELDQAKLLLPKDTDTLDDIDKHLEYQNKLYSLGNDEQRKGALLETGRLQRLRKLKELEAEADLIVAPEQIANYAELDAAVQHYQARMQYASATERAELQKIIDAYDRKRKAMGYEDAGVVVDPGKAKTGRDITAAISTLEEDKQRASTLEEVLKIERKIATLRLAQSKLDVGATIAGFESEMERLKSLVPSQLEIELKTMGVEGIQEKIRAIQSLLSDTSIDLPEETREMLKGLIGDWRKMGRNVTSVEEAVGQLGSAVSGLGSAMEMPEIDFIGVLAAAVATMIQAYATAQTQAVELGGPIGWIGFAATGLGVLAGIVSSVKGMAKFANGGIAYGPTLGLFGEYVGASSNPEVVAPLNKLRSLIQPAQGGPVAVSITGRVRGRDIELALANSTRISSKSGHKSNIVI